MFESLRQKVSRHFNPNNKDPVSRFIRNEDYQQNSEERRAQLIFLKLLMAVAAADKNVVHEEMELLKDFAFQHALNEEEWKEIEFYRHVDLSEAELRAMIDQIIVEIKSLAQKKSILAALEEMVQADDILKEQEKEILDLLRKKLNSIHTSVVDNWLRSMRKSINKKRVNLEFDDYAKEYSLNPVAAVLKRHLKSMVGANFDFDLAGAKMGLALILMHADDVIHEAEIDLFCKIVENECKVNSTEAVTVVEMLQKIPESHIEMARISRIIMNNSSEEDRKNLLKKLFQLAHADADFDPEEEKKLKIISKYLLISHKDYIAAKLS